MKENRSFILYQSYQKHLSKLTKEQKGDLFDAIFAHNVGEKIKLDPVTEMAFSFISEDIDINKNKWEDIKQKRREAGKQGGKKSGQAKESKRKQKKAKESKKEQKEANEAVNVNGNVNVSDIKKENKKEFDFIQNPEWKQLFSEYIAYRTANKTPLKPVSYKACFDKLVKLSGDNLTKASEIVGNTIANGWQGLFELKTNPPGKKDLIEKNDEAIRNYLRSKENAE